MNKKRCRKNFIVRKEEIINAAIDLALNIGYQSVTRDAVAQSISTSYGLINHYFPTITQLKLEIMRTAIDREVLPVIAQGLIIGDKQTLEISPELKNKVLAYLSIN